MSPRLCGGGDEAMRIASKTVLKKSVKLIIMFEAMMMLVMEKRQRERKKRREIFLVRERWILKRES